jgi:hypothetical protein
MTRLINSEDPLNWVIDPNADPEEVGAELLDEAGIDPNAYDDPDPEVIGLDVATYYRGNGITLKDPAGNELSISTYIRRVLER